MNIDRPDKMAKKALGEFKKLGNDVSPCRWQESSADTTFDWVTTENESTASEQNHLLQSTGDFSTDFSTVKPACQTLN